MPSEMSSGNRPNNRNRLSEIAKRYDPWPLGTDAMVRILAWPDYTEQSQVRKVLQASERLFGHGDACLCLRYDSRLDPPLETVISVINNELSKRDDLKEINILIVDDEIPESEWYRVGLTAFCTIGIKDASPGPRTHFVTQQHSEKLFV